MSSGFNVKVTIDHRPVLRFLNKIQRKQLPFATALALTRTAQNAQKAVQKQMPRKLDRPTPWTVKGIAIKSANKRNLIATVFIKPIQLSYLKYQIDGGLRHAKKKVIAIPTSNARKNRYGNVPGLRRGVANQAKRFIGTVGGSSGVWERKGGKRNPKVRKLFSFKSTVTYRARFPFIKIVDGVARNTFSREFDKAMKKALASVR